MGIICNHVQQNNEEIMSQNMSTKFIIQPSKQSVLEEFSYQLKDNIDSFDEDFYQQNYRLDEFDLYDSNLMIDRPYDSEQDSSSISSKSNNLDISYQSAPECIVRYNPPKEMKKSLFYRRDKTNESRIDTKYSEQTPKKSNLKKNKMDQLKNRKKVKFAEDVKFNEGSKGSIKKKKTIIIQQKSSKPNLDMRTSVRLLPQFRMILI